MIWCWIINGMVIRLLTWFSKLSNNCIPHCPLNTLQSPRMCCFFFSQYFQLQLTEKVCDWILIWLWFVSIVILITSHHSFNQFFGVEQTLFRNLDHCRDYLKRCQHVAHGTMRNKLQRIQMHLKMSSPKWRSFGSDPCALSLPPKFAGRLSLAMQSNWDRQL